MVAWLKHLISRKVIADGEVDRRSIAEVDTDDLRKFKQCHFFAGIGVWSYALRRAGWPDDFRVWTGSCPCTSFSASGKREGFSDPRHLWPSWRRHIVEHRPLVIFGEQVAKQDGRAWFDVVSSEMEEDGYTIGAAAIPACGFGAPHIRERIYFVAHADGALVPEITSARDEQILRNDSDAGAVDDTERRRREQYHAEQRRIQIARTRGATRSMGKSRSTRLERHAGDVDRRKKSKRITPATDGSAPTAGATNGFWSDALWIECSDKRLRPIPSELSFFPVVDGSERGRVGLIRGAGNSIVAPVAEAFIEAFVEEMMCRSKS